MKRYLPLLFVLLIALLTNAQTDTVWNYYQDGTIRSEHPMLNHQPYGTSRYFYFSGGLEIKLHTDYQSGKSTQSNYFENGKLKSISVNKNNQILLLKIYNIKGFMIRFEKKTRKGRIIKYWHEDGKPLSEERYSNGEPIGCVTMIDSINGERVERIYCYCNNKQVFWDSVNFINSEGKTVNEKFRFRRKLYFENGQLKSSIIQKGFVRKRKEWDENSMILTDTLEGIKPEPFYTNWNDVESSINIETYMNKNKKGWPILKTRNPPRDTTFQSSSIYIINDTTIQYNFRTTYYDSLGLANGGLSIDGYANRNNSIENNDSIKIEQYTADYIFYLTGRGDYFLGIGIRKDNPKVIILIANKGYEQILALGKDLKINN